MERIFLALFCAVLTVSSYAQQPSLTELRLARYTTAAGVPAVAETNPLQTIITVTFPRQQITTVAQAVDYLLIRTGYRLGKTAHREVEEVLALPLPEVHRRMGPYSVESADGPAFMSSQIPLLTMPPASHSP